MKLNTAAKATSGGDEWQGLCYIRMLRHVLSSDFPFPRALVSSLNGGRLVGARAFWEEKDRGGIRVQKP